MHHQAQSLRSAARSAAAAILIVTLALGSAHAAEQPATQPSLARRVADLERENDELRRRLDRLERAAAPAPAEAAPVATAPPAPPPAAATTTVAETTPDEEQPEGIGLGLTARYAQVRASFQIFGDAGFYYADPPEPDTDETSFALGALDLFTTAQLGDHFQVLSEIVAEGDSSNNEIDFELERLWGSWVANDALYVKLGREHSPVSYWNRHYHHGRYLWTSATQPFLARFEDDGGPLPLHQVGLEIGGKLDAGIGRLEYVGVLANGRGREPDEVTNFGDRNEAKAYDFGLSFAPYALPGLAFGGDMHADEIPHDPDEPDRTHAIRELIGSGYLAYFEGPFEALGEFAYLVHDDRTSDRTFRHRTGYLQLAYHFGDLTPYARIDARSMRHGDPFFAPHDIDLDGWEQVLGLRYELTSNAAVKLEGGFGRREERHDDGLSRRGFRSIGLQLAWGF